MFHVKTREHNNNNNTTEVELPSRQNSHLKFSGTGREGVTLYLVILLKVYEF